MAPQKLVLTIYDHFEMQQVSLPGPSQRNKGGLLVKVPKCSHNSQVLKSLAHVTRRAGPKVGLWRPPQRRVGLSGCDVGRDLIPRQEPDSDPRGVEEQGIYATTAVVEPGAKGTLSTIDSAPGSVNSKKRQPNVCCAAKPHPNKKKKNVAYGLLGVPSHPLRSQSLLSSGPLRLGKAHLPHVCSETVFSACPVQPLPSRKSISLIGFSFMLYAQLTANARVSEISGLS